MSHKCHECECKHENLRFCRHCNKPYCVDCGKEWEEPCTRSHYWPYAYCGGNYTTTSAPLTWTTTSGSSGTYGCTHTSAYATSTCAHSEES